MTKQTNIIKISLIASLLILSGCSSISLEQPKSNIPSVFNTKTIQSKESLNLNPNWWLLFNDDNLNKIIDYALENNKDLSIAMVNIKLAQNNLRLLEISQGPQQSVSASLSTDKNLKTGTQSSSNSIQYNLNYEVDLWGSFQNARNAQEWALMATEQDKESAKLSLISSIIDLYYQSIYLNEKILMALESVKYSKQLLDITTTKYKVGKLSGLELSQAKKSQLEQEYSLNEYKQNLSENLNALKLLMGLNPGEELPNNINIPNDMPERNFQNIHSDIPSNVLKNRPDVLAAQMRIQEAFYNVKDKELEFYPKFSLTTSLGNSTGELLKFISNPIGTIGASISLPFLDYSKNKENLKISENKYKVYTLEYEQTLLKAMKEVENRLSFYYYNKNNYEKVSQLYLESQKISKIYEVRYNLGASPLQDLLEAQESERKAYLNQLNHMYNLLNSESQVYQSLGGRYD